MPVPARNELSPSTTTSMRNLRCLSSSGGPSSSSTSSSTKKTWKQNGTPEIIVGATILSLLLIDTSIQQYNDNKASISRRAVIQELGMAIQNDQSDDHLAAMRSSIKNGTTKGITFTTSHPLIDINGKECKTLYKCQIMKIPKYFDGTKSLKNVHVDDIVQVIQEFVGPDSTYHLCKIYKKANDNDTNLKNRGELQTSGNDKERGAMSMIEKLDKTYEYGWFPISCLKKLS